MLLVMDGESLIHMVAQIFATCFNCLNSTVLWTLNGKNFTLWHTCLGFIGLAIFRDLLDIIGIWGYGDDLDIEDYDEYDGFHPSEDR